MLAEHGLTFERDDYVNRFMGLSTDAYHALVDQEAQARIGRPLGEEIRSSMRLRQNMVERLTEVPGATAAVATIGHRPRALRDEAEGPEV